MDALLRLPVRTARQTRDLVMVLLPHGGQRTARRNAWVGMSVGTARARARREADLAVHRAQLRADARPRRQAR